MVSGLSRSRMTCPQSGMFDSCDLTDDCDEIFPALLFRAEHLEALWREAIVAAPALLGLLHPESVNGAFLLQSMQQGVERGDVKLKSAAGAELDQLGNVVAMARLV